MPIIPALGQEIEKLKTILCYTANSRPILSQKIKKQTKTLLGFNNHDDIHYPVISLKICLLAYAFQKEAVSKANWVSIQKKKMIRFNLGPYFQPVKYYLYGLKMDIFFYVSEKELVFYSGLTLCSND